MIEETALPGGDDTPGCVAAVCAPSQSTEGDQKAGSGWLTGMWSTAKSQSANVLGFMRRDLGEFVSTVRTDTKDVVHHAAGVVRESVNRDTANEASSKLKSGLNRFLDTISSAMTIPPDDSGEEALVYGEGDWHPAKSRKEGRIISLQIDPKTYEEEPDDEHFSVWLETFDVDSKKPVISDLLVSNSTVRAVYARMVPNTLLHRVFWARYFYKLQRLENEEARWEALKNRAGREESSANDWGEDWDEESPAHGASSTDVGSSEAVKEKEEIVEGKPVEAATNVGNEEPVPEKAEEKVEIETVAEEKDEKEDVEDKFKVTEKLDVVVVKHKDSPESSSEGSAGVPEALTESQERVIDQKDLEDWEEDLDVEVTAEEIEEAKKTAREMRDANELDDDWDNWE